MLMNLDDQLGKSIVAISVSLHIAVVAFPVTAFLFPETLDKSNHHLTPENDELYNQDTETMQVIWSLKDRVLNSC